MTCPGCEHDGLVMNTADTAIFCRYCGLTYRRE